MIDNGRTVQLDDASQWKVSDFDRNEAANWQREAMIAARWRSGSASPPAPMPASRRVEREVDRTEQDRIVAAAGVLRAGEVAIGSWCRIARTQANEHREVVVIRTVGSPEFNCREIVVPVDRTDDKATGRGFYTATTCRAGEVCNGASAESETERWEAIQ